MIGQGEGWEDRIFREFEIDMYTLLYLKWITKKDQLDSTGNSAQHYVTTYLGKELKRIEKCICTVESLC